MSKALSSRNINDLLLSGGSSTSAASATETTTAPVKDNKAPAAKVVEKVEEKVEEDMDMGGLFDWKLLIFK